jgi:hypothetical protein
MDQPDIMRSYVCLFGWSLALSTPLGCVSASRRDAPPPAPEGSAAARLREEADALKPLVSSSLAREFLELAVWLPSPSPRTLYRDEARKTYYHEAAAAALPETVRHRLANKSYDDVFYYYTQYGTPLAYSRPLELLGPHFPRGVSGRRILDFGYGGIGQLRLLAMQGATVVGVDVDPLLHALYGEPEDQGVVRGPGRTRGRVTLALGRFPADGEVNRIVGGNFDLILSKNVLKRGYIHPAQEVDKRKLVQLGVDDPTFVRALHANLKPGGLVMIYNLCPAPSPPGQPYKPHADGRSPFSRALWEQSGFRILAFDQDDTPAARAMAKALRWDQGDDGMDLENDLFALYTLVEKPRGPE